jgi:hypothetical protein
MPLETAGGPATPNFRRTPTNSGLAKELHSFAEAAGLVAAFLFSLLVVALLLAALFVVALLLAALLLVPPFFASCLGLWCIKVVPAVRHLVIPLYFAIRIHTSRANGYPTSGELR